MKYKIENGTDGACMALYDREALPENYALELEDKEELPDIFELQNEGKCAVIPTDGDGSFWLYLYVNEVPPHKNKEFIINHIEMKKLTIPSGKLYYSGCEYISQKETELSKKNIHMLETIEIQKGDYQTDIFFMQYPDSYKKSYIKKRLSKRSNLILNSHRFLGFLALLGLFLAIVPIFDLTLAKRALFVIPLLSWFAVFWSPSYVASSDEEDTIESQLPDIIAELHG